MLEAGMLAARSNQHRHAAAASRDDRCCSRPEGAEHAAWCLRGAGNATALGALASHPIPLDLSPGLSDSLDSPACSPTAASAVSFASRSASPFK